MSIKNHHQSKIKKAFTFSNLSTFSKTFAVLLMLLFCTNSGKTASSEMISSENIGHEYKPQNHKTPSSIGTEKELDQQNLIAIKDVNIIPMTPDNTIIKNATIVIGDGKIVALNEQIPELAKVIDGSGKWLIPGLIDMHVHGLADINFSSDYPTKGATWFANTQDVMTPYVATGVTTIFELNARVEHFGQRNKINNGEVIGPRMALAALINGGSGSGRVVNTPAAGRQAVRSAKAEGYNFIKVYSDLNIETFKAVIEEAKKQGLKTIGHIPNAFQGKLEKAFVPNFNMIAHAEEFSKHANDYSYEEAKRFAKLAKENETWLTPTLITMERIADQAHSLDSVRKLNSFQYVHPLMQSKWITSNNYNKGTNAKRVAYFEKLLDFHFKLVKAFKEAGVPIVAGTDAGTSGVIWGFSLHDEIELLVEAGLSNEEALVSATRLPAVWLEMEDKIGTIEVGKFADLVLLDANPLENIKNTRKITGVFMNGRWVSKGTIDLMLADLAKRNSASKDKVEWSKRREF